MSEWNALLSLDTLDGVCGPSLVSHSFKQLSFPSSSSWSFVWSSLGLTAMAFVTGALGLWVPMFLYRAQVALGNVQQCLEKSCDSSNRWAVQGWWVACSAKSQVVPKVKADVTVNALWRQRGVNVRPNCFQVCWDAPICLFMITCALERCCQPCLSKMERGSKRNVYRKRSNTGKETSVNYWLCTSCHLCTHLGMFKSCILVTLLLPSC